MKSNFLTKGLIIFCLLSSSAFARNGHVRNVSATVGGNWVELVISGDASDNLDCNLSVDFGEGNHQNFEMRQDGQRFPLVISRNYNPGNYTVRVKNRGFGRNQCQGSAKTSFEIQ